MIRSKREKRERLASVIAVLSEFYPRAECALEFEGDPWKLLVMGRLSAQFTDARVNLVCKELFAKYPNAEAIAEADLCEIERIIKPCGLYRMKAENIYEASKIILRDYEGKLPETIDELVKLPGVGRKIANLIVGDVFGGEAIVCDTHFMRILGRIGIYSEKLRDPVKIEFLVRELMDARYGADFCHRIVTFGREICSARAPKCSSCPIAHLCDKHKVEGGK